jgi:hypothetical protein
VQLGNVLDVVLFDYVVSVVVDHVRRFTIQSRIC